MQENLHLAALVYTIRHLAKDKIAGSLVLDIGSFNGKTALFFHQEFPGCSVIGFEPGKESHEQCKKNIAGVNNVVIENLAVSDFNGTTEFFVTDNKVSSSLNPLSGTDERFYTANTEKVNTSTLDSYFEKAGLQQETILVIKLDVQGHELAALKGAIQTLKRTVFVLTEMSNHKSYSGGAQYYETDELLRQNGFILQNIYAGYSSEKYLYEYDAVYVNKELI
jgi:FkbM family methyltransferase